MKKIFLTVVAFAFLAAPAFADSWVKGHYTKDGNWVNGYWRTDANGTPDDNYSTYGNYNPHKPQPTPAPTPYTPHRDYGTNPFPGSSSNNNSSGNNIVTIPKLDAPVAGLHDKDCPPRTSIYQPSCP